MTAAAEALVTRAEIAAAIARHVERYRVKLDSADEMYHPFDALTNSGTSPWRDLRPSQERRLDEILEEAETRAFDRCRAILSEEATAAALAFAAEHPDAPRAAREPVTA